MDLGGSGCRSVVLTLVLLWGRNGNGSGSGWVFPYPNPTRGSIPEARTRPVY